MLCVPQVVIKRPYWIWSPQEATHRGRKSLQRTKTPMERYTNTDLVVFKWGFFKTLHISGTVIQTTLMLMCQQDLIDDLKYELTGKFERLIVSLMRTPAYHDAKEIHDAVKVRH